MTTRAAAIPVLLCFAIIGLLPAPTACRAAEKLPAPFEEKYTDHSMIFLLYEVTVELGDDWSYTTTQHKKLKILKEDARSMGDVPIPYDKSREEITALSAHTITPSGEKLEYAAIHDLPAFEGYAMYSDQMVRMVTMPAVSAGSVIEYKATVLTKGEAMGGQFWYAADLDSGVPIRKFALTVTVPAKAAVAYRGFGLEHEPEIVNDGAKVSYRWRIDDLYTEPDDEEFPPPPRAEDLRNRIEFSSTKSWAELAGWYYGVLEKNAVPDESIQGAARELARIAGDRKGKVRAILGYLQERFRYVMMSFGENTLKPRPVAEVFRDKYGDCKDLSLLFVCMLREIGVTAHVALFNFEAAISDPRSHLPTPALFDHVVVEVEDPDGAYYVDPLLAGYDIGQYPLGYEGAYTFVITGDGGRFGRFPLSDENGVYQSEERTITIAADGSALVEWRALYDLDTSVGIRRLWKSATDATRRRFQESSAAMLAQGGRMIENSFENIDAAYGTVTNVAVFERPGMYAVTDGMIVVDVEGFDGAGLFAQTERKKNVFYPHDSRTDRKTSIYIPEGYDVSHLPEGFTEEIGLFGLSRQYRREGRRIDIYETERYKRGELPAGDYNKLRDFMARLTATSKQRIILKEESEAPPGG